MPAARTEPRTGARRGHVAPVGGGRLGPSGGCGSLGLGVELGMNMRLAMRLRMSLGLGMNGCLPGLCRTA